MASGITEKTLPKINFKLISVEDEFAQEHVIILNRDGVKEILGSWDNYRTVNNITTWYHLSGKVDWVPGMLVAPPKGSLMLVAMDLTPKQIDDFINDDFLGGVLFGAAVLGGAIVGTAAAISGAPYYPYSPVYSYPYPVYSPYSYGPYYSRYGGYGPYGGYGGYRNRY